MNLSGRLEVLRAYVFGLAETVSGWAVMYALVAVLCGNWNGEQWPEIITFLYVIAMAAYSATIMGHHLRDVEEY